MRRLGSVLLASVSLGSGGCVPRLYSSEPTATVGTWVPPENGWFVGTPPADLRGTGLDPGQTVPDFRLFDQHGDDVSLWQFYGHVVVIDISTIWCAPCQDLAQGVQGTADEYGADGFTYLTVLQQDLDGNPPDVDDLNLWTGEFEMVTPVLSDGDMALVQAIKNGSYPALLLVDRDLTVVRRINPPTDEEIREQLDGILGR